MFVGHSIPYKRKMYQPFKHSQTSWSKARKTYVSIPKNFLLKGECSFQPKKIVEPKEIILREDVPFDIAKNEIINFLKQNEGEIFISEIIQTLKLDMDIIMDVLEQLYDEGCIDRTD